MEELIEIAKKIDHRLRSKFRSDFSRSSLDISLFYDRVDLFVFSDKKCFEYFTCKLSEFSIDKLLNKEEL